MTFEQYKNYWFGSFGVVMVQGRPEDHGNLSIPRGDWNQYILGTFYIKPNYPGMRFLRARVVALPSVQTADRTGGVRSELSHL